MWRSRTMRAASLPLPRPTQGPASRSTADPHDRSNHAHEEQHQASARCCCGAAGRAGCAAADHRAVPARSEGECPGMCQEVLRGAAATLGASVTLRSRVLTMSSFRLIMRLPVSSLLEGARPCRPP